MLQKYYCLQVQQNDYSTKKHKYEVDTSEKIIPVNNIS